MDIFIKKINCVSRDNHFLGGSGNIEFLPEIGKKYDKLIGKE